MAEKKKAINISMLLIIASLLGTVLCWAFLKNNSFFELVFALCTGIFGSSFATLWIFIVEYKSERDNLLSMIFSNGNRIRLKLPSFTQYNNKKDEMLAYLNGRYYVPPIPEKQQDQLNDNEKTLYSLCRYVDHFLEIGYEDFVSVFRAADQLAFWTDFFTENHSCFQNKLLNRIVCKNNELARKGKRERIIEKLLPLYDIYLSAPAMEEGYLFRVFREFKYDYSISAADIYSLVLGVEERAQGINVYMGDVWDVEKAPDFRCYFYETLWVFRDAFFSPYLPRERRKRAISAFMKGTPYTQIR